jgi:hypothetical protein
MTKESAWLERARCLVVMFLRPAMRVAPAPRMSWEERELKARRTSRREVEIWGVREGREEVKDRNVLRAGRRAVALDTRMKRFWSMVAGLV